MKIVKKRGGGGENEKLNSKQPAKDKALCFVKLREKINNNFTIYEYKKINRF